MSRSDVATKSDVVNATLILLTLCTLSAIATIWVGLSISPSLASLIGMIGGGGVLASTIVLLFSPSLQQKTRGVGIFLSLTQGMMLGGFTFFVGSYQFNGVSGWNLVTQALMGTTSLFFIALLLYKTGAIRVSRGFTKFMIFACGAFAALYALNFVIFLVTKNNLLLGNGPIPIIVGVAAIILGTLSLIHDFNTVDTMIEAGSQHSYVWMLATSLVSSLVWLYTEILRVLFLFNRE